MARLVDAGSDPQFHPQRESYWVKVNPRGSRGVVRRGQALPLHLPQLAPKDHARGDRLACKTRRWRRSLSLTDVASRGDL